MAAAAAGGLGQGAVQPGGPSTHWIHWTEEAHGEMKMENDARVEEGEKKP